MKRLKSTVAILFSGLVFSLLALPGGPWDALLQGRLDGAILDRFFQIRGGTDVRDDIVILGINSESMEFFSDEIEKYPDLGLLTDWPWPREVHAILLDRLVEAGARVVAFDILFLSPSLYGDRDDLYLKEALVRHRDRAVIGLDFEDQDRRSGRSQLVRPTTRVLREDLLETVAGYVKYPRELDGRIRRAHFETTEAVGSGISIDPLAGEPFLLSFPAQTVKKADSSRRLPDWRETLMIHYAGPAGSYPQFPVSHVLHDRYWEHNFQGGEFFQDKIVLIGATAGFMHDVHETPFGAMAGVEIHANSVGMLLEEKHLREAPRWVRGVLTLAAGLGVASGILLWQGPYVVKFLLLVAAGGTGIAGSYWLFAQAGIVVAFPDPYLALFGAGLTGMTVQFTAEQMEKRRLRRTFGTFLSPDVAEYLVEHPEEYQTVAVGKRRYCVILFSDIRGFTSLTEQAKNPEEFVAQLNEYLSAWVECVFATKGTLDKFVGDAVMAVWGGIRSEGPREDARAAVEAALAMREELERLNRRWKAEGKPEFRIGVGIGAGEAMVGNMGSPGRKLEFTVIGDAVNVAARLEGETKNYGRDLLVSEEIQRLVETEFATEFLGEARVRGKSAGVKVFAVN